MLDKLYAYIDSIFEQAPCTQKAIELKEEIRQNSTEKYEDLLTQGKTEEAAYNITVASMGDIGELIGSLRGDTAAAAPPVDKTRRRSALLTAIAISLYILSVVPCILLQDDMIGPVLLFVMVALATGLLIYNHMSAPKYRKREDTMVEEFREWSDQHSRDRQIFKAVSSALWSLTAVIYILVSFLTMAWHITWVIFLVAGAIEGIIKAIFDLRK